MPPLQHSLTLNAQPGVKNTWAGVKEKSQGKLHAAASTRPSFILSLCSLCTGRKETQPVTGTHQAQCHPGLISWQDPS